MLRLPLLLFALGCNAASGNGESGRTQACSAQIEFAPVLVSNPDTVVTFTCDHASSLQLIQAAGRQTRLPIGIVLGNDPTILSRKMRSFSLAKLDAKSTLLEAIAGTGYSLNESNGTFVLIAGDLTRVVLGVGPLQPARPGQRTHRLRRDPGRRPRVIVSHGRFRLLGSASAALRCTGRPRRPHGS